MYGCSLVAKLEKKILKKGNICFLEKHIIHRKKLFILKKYSEKNFLAEKNFEIYFYTVCVTNKNINLFQIYSFCKKYIFDH